MPSRGLIAIESSPDGDVVHIHGCPTGLRRLGEHLLSLAAKAERGDFPHDHFFTPEWGGSELSVLRHDPEQNVVHHLKVFGWPTPEGGAPYQSPSQTRRESES